MRNDLGMQLALAYIRGDKVAMYALSDLIQEERFREGDKLEEILTALRNHPMAHDSYTVYRWPEFQAFCKRAGIMWGLRTVDLEIILHSDEIMMIRQNYRGTDSGEQPLDH